MFRLLVRSAFVIAALTAAALLLIHVRGYDDSAVTSFFDACTPMPCWQGIHPGETTTAEALAILRAHPWVESVSEVYASPTGTMRTALIYWIWSSSYPFVGSFPAQQQGIVITDREIVQQIYLTTSIALGDIWLALGIPDGGTVEYMYDTRHLRMDNSSLFAHKGIAATATIITDCTDIHPNFWRTPVYLWLQDGESLGVENVTLPVYMRVMRTGYHQVRSSFC